MKIIQISHPLIILILLHLAYADTILNDYGNGNKGVGINDKVNGTNNTWIGNQNSIDGKENFVKGDQNNVTGSNNYVQGSGNVIGNLSPEQLAQLQNQMAEKMQQRFSGLFGGSFLKKGPIKPVANAQNNQTLQTPKQTIQAHNESSIQAATNQTNATVAKNISKELPKQNKIKINKHKLNDLLEKVESKISLIFRSYGKPFKHNQFEDLYNLRDQLAENAIEYCGRWNDCGDKQQNSRRMFYSSVYPVFA